MADDELRQAMAALWAKAKGPAIEAIHLIVDAAGGDDADAHAAARVESHKLAGMLGMYGMKESSDAALALDADLTGGALDDPARRPDVIAAATALMELVEAER